jgi:hypothetical protein
MITRVQQHLTNPAFMLLALSVAFVLLAAVVELLAGPAFP